MSIAMQDTFSDSCLNKLGKVFNRIFRTPPHTSSKLCNLDYRQITADALFTTLVYLPYTWLIFLYNAELGLAYYFLIRNAYIHISIHHIHHIIQLRIHFSGYSAAGMRCRSDQLRPVRVQQDLLYSAALPLRHDRRLCGRNGRVRLQWVYIFAHIFMVNRKTNNNNKKWILINYSQLIEIYPPC